MSFVLASTALQQTGPIARTSELRERGVSKRELARAHRAGEIIKVRQGVYAALGTDDLLLHAAEHGGAPGCAGAGRLHGLWMLDDESETGLHLWLGHAAERHACDRTDCARSIRMHWDDGVAGLGAVPPVHNTLLQIALCLGEEPFFVALESALRQSRLPRNAERWLRRRLPEALKWLVNFARADADSGLESLIRLRMHRVGVDMRSQVLIDGVGEVDFVIGDRLIVEADGKENHDDDPGVSAPLKGSRRHKDLVRDAKAAALGYETLRFDYALIVHDWPTVEAAILAKVRAGAHLGDSFARVAA
ncbi:type IV toxin-antitoxin system AbiEi family antitoxin domain-containing protein [Microbacterium sp. NPDC077644]|uniref:type IV toxin-antitoxin system AbiEi family antitoxin domain-containing protein n=1 Tax=Microbacterium sp. NPDC077644 TaxID=3155055 RepID=UPI00344D8775